MSVSSLPDHYGTLGLERGADEATVKKAYRKLVLQWHPDKHPADREEAEVKIRQINDAYETLSNPFKKSQYDQQISAFERKAQGVRLNTAGVKPRMAIPKEFMLSPMGHPAKFVRCVGNSAFVQARSDVSFKNVHTAFTDFFRDAKFSLWWLPQVNNMCRLRAHGSSSGNHGAGINMNFALANHISSSEVFLSPAEERESSALIAVASATFEGAFRFESACFPGHYLAFKPPTHLRMMGGVVDETTVIDFTLVDFSQMFRFITMDEVLLPAIVSLGGDRTYVSLEQILADMNIRVYFEKVLQRAPWNYEDFGYFFGSRSDEFDYDSQSYMVRLRSKQEQLSNSLQRAKSAADLAASISRADDRMLELLPLETVEMVLETLGQPPPVEEGASAVVNHMDAQKKILAAMHKACEQSKASFKQLLSLHAKIVKFGGEALEAKIAAKRSEAARSLGGFMSDEISKNGVGDEFTFQVFCSMCEMVLDWKLCGEDVAKAAEPLLRGKSLTELLPPLRALVKASAGAAVELVGRAVWDLLPKLGPEEVAEALEVMATGGYRLSELPSSLLRVARQGASFTAIAGVVSALGERSVEGDEMRACVRLLTDTPNAMSEGLPPQALMRVMVAATKSAAVAEVALDGVAAAASVVLHSFGMDDISKLLLAVSKAKSAGGAGVSNLYNRASEVVSPKLRELSVVQLIKIVLAIGKEPACRPLLEAAGLDTIRRMPEISQSPSHLVLLMQGVAALGDGDRGDKVLVEILELLVKAFDNATEKENQARSDLVIDKRRELEAKGQLTADQVAKLAQIFAPAVRREKFFWEALGSRMQELPKSLSAAGFASMETAFPSGGGPEFEGKRRMLRAVDTAREARERGGRDAVDMTSREKAIERQQAYEKREAIHKSKMDKEAQEEEKARQKERERAMQKGRGRSGRSRSQSRKKKDSRSQSRKKKDSRSRSRDRKDKNRDKDKKRQRSRSRSRSRDRDRRR
eukprot:TRINITY_DN108670_c0_g1_i1.p1 TRINITY_DN108670_c0_g1~~TRINITY_DN108670_c0_g1_i1.p1  ORF type:complete len:981 (-),score=222.15 TRINITY_DN108670_c0_g1_i1:17-2959(-)